MASAPRVKAVMVFVVLLFGLYFARIGNRSGLFAEQFSMYHDFNAHYSGTAAKFIAYDDGVFAFATGRHVLCGTRLALDSVAYKRLVQQDESFLEIALDRGYDHVILTRLTVAGKFDAALLEKHYGERLEEEYIGAFEAFNNDYLAFPDRNNLDVLVDYVAPNNEIVVLRLKRRIAP
ncbi:MAG TPA: hypothetical protein ENN29_05015 [Candidatus Hydrogenedentes bacterium]|nr:hypothetical protein [Candidatus Hydrogenedentota bacterium]